MVLLKYLTDSDRLSITPTLDEYIFTKDTRTLYYGDGVTAGGRSLLKDELAKLFVNSSNTNFSFLYDHDSQTIKVDINFPVLVDQVTEQMNSFSTAVVNKIDDANFRTNALDVRVASFDTQLSTLTKTFDTLKVSKADPLTIDAPPGYAFLTLNGVLEPYKSAIQFNASRGTLELPTSVQSGDALSGFKFAGYDGEKQSLAVAFGGHIDPDETVSVGNTPGAFMVAVTASGPCLVNLDRSDMQIMRFNSKGTLTAPVIQPGVYANINERDAYILFPTAGMMIFVQDAGSGQPQFQGHNGTSWVNLG